MNEKLFFNKINKTPTCWLWTAGTNHGYGFFGIRKDGKLKLFYAHRLSWLLHKGSVPDEMCVLHTCDNRLCVNPKHLFLGTKRDNALDKLYKGRHIKGSQVWSSKLVETQVVEIKRQRQTRTIESLANEYGVSRHTIMNICAGRTWKHLDNA